MTWRHHDRASVVAMFPLLLLLLSHCPSSARAHVDPQHETFHHEFRVADVHTRQEDAYMFFTLDMPSDASERWSRGYITRFEPLVDVRYVHHMIVFVDHQIVWVWAHNGTAFSFDDGLGFFVDEPFKPGTFSVQFHFRSPVDEKFQPSGFAIDGVFGGAAHGFLDVTTDILMSSMAPLPARAALLDRSAVYRVNIVDRDTGEHIDRAAAVAVAFRTHAHSTSLLIYADHFRPLTPDSPDFAALPAAVRESGVIVYRWLGRLGNRSPQLPQRFVQFASPVRLQDGDVLENHCVYSTSGRPSRVYFGSAHTNEMCNFYLMHVLPTTRDDDPRSPSRQVWFRQQSSRALDLKTTPAATRSLLDAGESPRGQMWGEGSKFFVIGRSNASVALDSFDPLDTSDRFNRIEVDWAHDDSQAAHDDISGRGRGDD